MKVETIIFDLSEVLIAGIVGIEDRLGELLNVPPEQILASLNHPLLQAFFCGQVSEDEFVAQMLASTGAEVDPGQVKALVRENFRHRVPGMDSVLAELQGRYRLVLLSDHAAEWVVEIRRIHPFLSQFDPQFYSFQLGSTKRQPVTFERVLVALGQPAETCLFIDDNPHNITIAKRAGILGIVFRDAAQLQSELAVLGVGDGLQAGKGKVA